jgi:plasmid stabilization system protein ParE
MRSNDVSERSPLRVLERALGGGLGRGQVGTVLARNGVGKTAFLIGMALDAMLRERCVLHISTKESVERLREFYDEIFGRLAVDLALENLPRRRLEIERRRHILVYNRNLFSLEKLAQSVSFLREAADFQPSLVIMDGTPRFEKTEPWEMEGVLDLAREWDAEIWTSALTHREGQHCDGRGVPEEVARLDRWLSVILYLEPEAENVRVRVLKDRDRPVLPDLRVQLDPTTWLLRWR